MHLLCLIGAFILILNKACPLNRNTASGSLKKNSYFVGKTLLQIFNYQFYTAYEKETVTKDFYREAQHDRVLICLTKFQILG